MIKEYLFILSILLHQLKMSIMTIQCNFSFIMYLECQAKVDGSDSIGRSEFHFVLVLLPVIVLECQLKNRV